MSIIEKIKDYFFKSGTFEETFLGWAQDHAALIDLKTTENKLEYTPLHAEFLTFFEANLEGVIADNGSTVREFYAALREVALLLTVQSESIDPEGENTMFVKIMLSAIEYEMFIMMMREVATDLARSRK